MHPPNFTDATTSSYPTMPLAGKRTKRPATATLGVVLRHYHGDDALNPWYSTTCVLPKLPVVYQRRSESPALLEEESDQCGHEERVIEDDDPPAYAHYPREKLAHVLTSPDLVASVDNSDVKQAVLHTIAESSVSNDTVPLPKDGPHICASQILTSSDDDYVALTELNTIEKACTIVNQAVDGSNSAPAKWLVETVVQARTKFLNDTIAQPQHYIVVDVNSLEWTDLCSELTHQSEQAYF